MKKKCKLCGKEFEGKGRQSICNDTHYNTCIVCNKKFKVDKSTYMRLTCSKECQIQANRINAINRLKNKPKTTNKTSAGKYLRTCILCGESFRSSGTKRNICYNDHIVACEICGKEFHIGPPDYQYKRTCSAKCAAELRARELESEYGVRSSLQKPEVIAKIKKTNLDRYGVENPLSSPEIREQIKATCVSKYGVEFATQSDSMKSKSRKTCLERYGVEVASQNEDIKQKIANTNLEKYGVDNIFKSDDFRIYMKRLMQDRYGVDYYTQTEDFKQKQSESWDKKYGGNPWSSKSVRDKCNCTNLKLYGDIWPQRTSKIKQKQLDSYIQHRADSIQDPVARENYLNFKKDPQKYIEEHSNLGIPISNIAEELGYSDGTLLYDYIHKHGLDSVLRWSGMSKMEQEVLDFIHQLDNTIEVKIHDRTVIYPKELDLYLPKYKLGIECNPTITHNSTYVLGNALGGLNVPPTPLNYHAIKTDMCQQKGIQLFHIFGYEWTNHKQVILSMIRNLLNKNIHKYYARNLSLKEVSYNDSILFLDANHRQGSAMSSIRLGLYEGNELISLMTFGKVRTTIGDLKSRNRGTVELIRFCNKLNTTVVGGASKLFKYFVSNYSFDKVISFSDKAHTKGNLYTILGFHFVHSSEPGYVWVNLATNLYFNRVSCQKHKLPKLFNQPNLDIENQTEQQIMSSKGFVQVFDSGTIRWEYEKKIVIDYVGGI